MACGLLRSKLSYRNDMKAIDEIKSLIENQSSFLLEAGAGSGKTFTLIETIAFILETKGAELRYLQKSIICITYTNVAKNEIIERLENNPLVSVYTIHEFLWGIIKNFQKQLLVELDELNTKLYAEKPDKFQPGLLERGQVHEVVYNDNAFRDFETGQLHHDDVIVIARAMFEKYDLLNAIVAAKHPYIFVDEYQDTAEDTIKALVDSLLLKHKDKIVIGFFGDSYQKIYDSGIGSLDEYVSSGKLTEVKKEDNYRSSLKVIDLLNKVRDNIKQVAPTDKTVPVGSAIFINCSNYPEKAKKEKVTDYERSLVPIKNANYERVIEYLQTNGWKFGDKSPDKVLIIANSRVAERGGFGELYKIAAARYFDPTEALMKRENILVRFFLGSVDKKTSKERKSGIEHLILSWQEKDYNAIMFFLNTYGKFSKNYSGGSEDYLRLRKHSDKNHIAAKIAELEELRYAGTVGQVFEFAVTNNIIKQQDSLTKYLQRIETNFDGDIDDETREKISRDIEFFDGIMVLPYKQFINLFKHTQNQTVFSTKHGTKGDQFRNVLVVIDDTSWKTMYNFESFIDGTEANDNRKLRTKNLFYVSCSRAVENLVVLALSQMSNLAMSKIDEWFTTENVFEIETFEK
jgi:DNA helicase-2/ATP-dependent DNA helicase PcrA